jgi:hypothetical protein
MLARALSCAVVGLDSALVEVEVDLSQGLPAFTIVGLPDTAVNEAKERVRAAIRNSGLHFPMRRPFSPLDLAPPSNARCFCSRSSARRRRRTAFRSSRCRSR